MPDVNQGDRPLSPFMIGPYYRPQLTSITSILTRITGISLLAGALLVVWWFLAAATSPEYFATADGLITSWFGDLVMTLSLWALWYHSLAGLRHLYWDTGRGLEIETAEKLGIAVIAGSVLLTIITLLVI
jgi:succinate dehydrogenase cytochrome b subunit